MPHELIGERVGEAAKLAIEVGTDEVHRRWGLKGCLTVTSAIVALVMPLLWVLGVFS